MAKGYMMRIADYLKMAAAEIERQALENPDIGIPVDPDVAEYMGAFPEPAIDPGDFDPPDDEKTDAEKSHQTGPNPA
jgi:hypothetical protein